MPDPDRKTISATQSPALFDASPYLTRFTLFHHLKGNVPKEPETDRMRWGTRMQPLIAQDVAARLNLEVIPNFSNSYRRSRTYRSMGCTVDALVNCPQRGPGAIEIKCVFEPRVWGEQWEGGKSIPRGHELQLQHQLVVGDGSVPFQWGVIAAWHGGELTLYERELGQAVLPELTRRCDEFMRQVERNKVPEPFGDPIEDAFLRLAFPYRADAIVDLRNRENGREIGEQAELLDHYRREANSCNKAADSAKRRLLIAMKGANKMLLPNGTVTLTETERAAYTVKAHLQQRVTCRLHAVSRDDFLDE
jgi:hypothetical protein